MSGHPESFISKYVFSQDHKVIAKQYMITGLFMALAGGGAASMIRGQLAMAEPGGTGGFLDPQTYNAVVTLHGTIMVFWVAMPVLVAGFGNLLIPLMVGADDMEFPKLNMASYWVFLLSTVILLSSMFVPGGGAAGGWTSYPPLAAQVQYSGVNWGITLWILAVALEIVAFLMGGINFITTAINMRAPGMTMWDIPIFVWEELAASIVFMLSVGPLVAGAVMLLLDHTAGTTFFDARPAGVRGGESGGFRENDGGKCNDAGYFGDHGALASGQCAQKAGVSECAGAGGAGVRGAGAGSASLKCSGREGLGSARCQGHKTSTWGARWQESRLFRRYLEYEKERHGRVAALREWESLTLLSTLGMLSPMLLFLFSLACSGSDKESVSDSTSGDSQPDSEPADPCERVDGATGTLALTFEMEGDYISVMDEPPVGNFEGSVFSCEDAGAAGPNEGAISLLDITVLVDLQPSGGPTGVLYTTTALPSEKVWVLGCLDTDGNGCDKGDPVTVPTANRVTVVPDTETSMNVFFGLLNPS